MSTASSNIKKLFLTISFFPIFLISFSQIKSFLKISNGRFPDNWDAKRDLRGRNGKVLIWLSCKNYAKKEFRSCISFVSGLDSSGNLEYFISENYSDTKPFTKWNKASIHYSPNQSDSTGFYFGYWDLHLEKFTHKPTESELYELLKKWKFSIFDNQSKTLFVGIDEALWHDTFGFVPDRKKLVN